jgi:hypothetical protein
VTTRRPPESAAWLLRHFGGGSHSDSLAGDLFEEYQHGRSPLWYWKQVGAAILIARWRGIRAFAMSLAKAFLWVLIELAVVVGAVALADAGTKSSARCVSQTFTCHVISGADGPASRQP